MGNITIPIKRFEELLYKEAAYEMKRQELKASGYMGTTDKVLFGLCEEPAETEPADGDF